MKALQTIIFLLLFGSQLNSQDFAQHTLVNCKKENCFKKHKTVTVDYDSLSGLKIIKTAYSFGKNLSMPGGVTPRKVKSVQEVVASNGKRIKVCRSVTRFRGDALRGCGSSVSFDKQLPGFYVYDASKLFVGKHIKRYDATGNLLEKK